MPPRRQPTELEQLIAAQAQLAQVMAQFMANNNNGTNYNNPPPQEDVLIKFLRLEPPTYQSFSEPTVSEKWMHTVNKNLVTIGCPEVEKVRLATHLLRGHVATWWNKYQVTHSIEKVTWDMFQKLFRAAHVSCGVMNTHKRGLSTMHGGNHTTARYMEASQDVLKEPRACKTCGDIGHTYKEHQDECPYCDGSHLAGECPMLQVTCFLCEGNDHVPIQCRIYPMVEQGNQGVKDGMYQALRKIHENSRSNSKVGARVKPHGATPNVTTKCCYSCGEEGHISSNCSKK